MTSECTLRIKPGNGPEMMGIVCSFVLWHAGGASPHEVIFDVDHREIQRIHLVVTGMTDVFRERLDLVCMLPSRQLRPMSAFNISVNNYDAKNRTGWISFPSRDDFETMVAYAKHHNGIVR